LLLALVVGVAAGRLSGRRGALAVA
jgi:hypothetical protein